MTHERGGTRVPVTWGSVANTMQSKLVARTLPLLLHLFLKVRCLCRGLPTRTFRRRLRTSPRQMQTLFMTVRGYGYCCCFCLECAGAKLVSAHALNATASHVQCPSARSTTHPLCAPHRGTSSTATTTTAGCWPLRSTGAFATLGSRGTMALTRAGSHPTSTLQRGER